MTSANLHSFDQRLRFEEQMRQHAQGDSEAASGIDEQFCQSLEYGLPPTGLSPPQHPPTTELTHS